MSQNILVSFVHAAKRAWNPHQEGAWGVRFCTKVKCTLNHGFGKSLIGVRIRDNKIMFLVRYCEMNSHWKYCQRYRFMIILLVTCMRANKNIVVGATHWIFIDYAALIIAIGKVSLIIFQGINATHYFTEAKEIPYLATVHFVIHTKLCFETWEYFTMRIIRPEVEMYE